MTFKVIVHFLSSTFLLSIIYIPYDDFTNFQSQWKHITIVTYVLTTMVDIKISKLWMNKQSKWRFYLLQYFFIWYHLNQLSQKEDNSNIFYQKLYLNVNGSSEPGACNCLRQCKSVMLIDIEPIFQSKK